MRIGCKGVFNVAAAIVVLLTLGSAAWAQSVITPVARLLRVRATANGNTNMPPDRIRNPDVYGSLSHMAQITNGTVTASGSASTSVQPNHISLSASGSASVNPPLSGNGDGEGQGVATVSLSADTVFRVGYNSPDTSGRLSVRDASGVIVHQHSFPQFISYTLSLPGGIYSFDFSYQDGSNPGGSSGGSTGSVEIAVIPEPTGVALGVVAVVVCALRAPRRR